MSGNDRKQSDVAHADIGIVCALRMELAPFLKRCDRVRKVSGGHFVFRGGLFDGIRIAIVESGPGFARARQATRLLIETHTPRWVLSAGFSGGLIPEMQVGDIVMANAVCDVHGQEFKIDLHLGAGKTAGLHVGKLLTTDHIVRTVEEKKSLSAEYGAIAVDLESLAVAQACRELHQRFLAVRTISDDLSADVPAEAVAAFASSGYRRLGATAGSIWRRPGSAKELWQIWEQAQKGAEQLAGFLEGVVTQLHAARQ